MTRYLVGIDNGSQSSKVTIFDERGSIVSVGRCALRPTVMPGRGLVEHPGDDLWESIVVATRRAFDGFDGDRADIVGVGLCTIRFCRALLRHDGRLASPILSWMDDRVGRPYSHADDEVAKVTTSSGYVTHRLTGSFRDTSANYQGMWPIDAETWEWLPSGDSFEAFGLRREQLVELVAPGEVLGVVTAEAAASTGLPQGLPVVATSNDKAVEALGSGLSDPSTLLISLGTYIAAMAVAVTSPAVGRSFWTNFGAVPGEYLLESRGVRRGMWTVSWFRDLVGGGTASMGGPGLEEVLGAEAEAIPAGSEGLIAVLDWLAPDDAPFRRGTLLGFDGRHGRAHIYRAILEAIALTMERHARAMERELGTRFTSVVLSGGGSLSPLLAQIFADVFDLPVERRANPDGAGLGAAMTAAVGLGVHASFAEARRAMVAPRDRFEPVARQVDTYARLAPLHGDVVEATDPLYRRLAEIAGP